MGSMEEVSGKWQKASAFQLQGANAIFDSHASRDMHASGKFQEVSSMGSMEEVSGKVQKASTLTRCGAKDNGVRSHKSRDVHASGHFQVISYMVSPRMHMVISETFLPWGRWKEFQGKGGMRARTLASLP